KKHGDLKVAILGSLGLACLITAMIIHELAPKHQHSEEFITIIVTILGSTLLIISHLRNRKLCATEHYTCHK
ncbi:MAG: MerC domain-containing protein, partial [Gammaproteobacteria bacterium]